MKKLLYIICFVTLAMTSCKETIQPVQQTITSDAVTNDMVSIDEISECEAIIEDSTLMDSKGERSWSKKGNMIRIKNGDKSYLRMQTKDGSVTAVTYKYLDD